MLPSYQTLCLMHLKKIWRSRIKLLLIGRNGDVCWGVHIRPLGSTACHNWFSNCYQDRDRISCLSYWRLVVGRDMYICTNVKKSYADSWLGEVNRLYVGDRE